MSDMLNYKEPCICRESSLPYFSDEYLKLIYSCKKIFDEIFFSHNGFELCIFCSMRNVHIHFTSQLKCHFMLVFGKVDCIYH